MASGVWTKHEDASEVRELVGETNGSVAARERDGSRIGMGIAGEDGAERGPLMALPRENEGGKSAIASCWIWDGMWAKRSE